MIKKMRIYVSEKIIELGFLIFPKFESEDYLYDLFEGLNVKHLKVKCRNNDGSSLTTQANSIHRETVE